MTERCGEGSVYHPPAMYCPMLTGSLQSEHSDDGCSLGNTLILLETMLRHCKQQTPNLQCFSASLKTLDEARKLVNIAEFGTAEPDRAYLQKYPDVTKAIDNGELWATQASKELGISSKLGFAILTNGNHAHPHLFKLADKAIDLMKKYSSANGVQSPR